MKYSAFFKLFLILFVLLIIAGCGQKTGSLYKKLTSNIKKAEAYTALDAIAVWQNNSEGNWDIAYSIYKQDSNEWLHQPNRDIYYEGNANLVAKLPGDDNDPDIASTKHSAIAVWSNSGAPGNSGADIFAARWSTQGWDEPARLFNLEGDDVDPTIYLQDPNNALVVWINKNNGKSSLYYSLYAGGGWSDPRIIEFSAEIFSSPELGYTTLPGSRYLLVFTARANNLNRAFTGSFDKINGWQIIEIGGQRTEAITNESVPAKYKTSASIDINSRKMAVSWSGKDGNVWLMKTGPNSKEAAASIAGQGYNPVIMHISGDARGADTIIFSNQEGVLNTTPAGGSSRQNIFLDKTGGIWTDAVYFIEQRSRSAVAVFNSGRGEGGEIYFSVLNKGSQQWSGAEKIDKKGFPGNDKNPAVAPILIKFSSENKIIKEDDYIEASTFCGNKILESIYGEKCEIGIPCLKADEECDWDYYIDMFGAWLAQFFAECKCDARVGDNVPLPPAKGAKDDSKKKSKPEKKEIIYGGASCGFDRVALKSAIGEDGVKLQFLPETKPTNAVIDFYGPYPKYQAESVALFPLSAPPHDKYFVMANFSANDDIITMIAIDISTGFQLCTGIFTKGAPPDSGGMVPAQAQ